MTDPGDSPIRSSASSTPCPTAPACTSGRMPRATSCTWARRSGCRSRVRSYFATDFADSPKNRLLQRLIADVETIVVPSEARALILENNLIKEYRPRFNVRLQGRQELSLHRRHAGRAVPPRPRHPPARHPRRPILRPLHRRGPAAAHAGHHPPALHRAELPRRSAAGAPGAARASTITSAGAGARASAGRTQAELPRHGRRRRRASSRGGPQDLRVKVREAMLEASDARGLRARAGPARRAPLARAAGGAGRRSKSSAPATPT